MYRFLLKPKWIAFHLLVIAAIVAMINLGLWQLRRLDDRRAVNRAVAEHSQAPVADDPSVLTADLDVDQWEWRTMRVRGVYVDRSPIEAVNRSANGEQGKAVLGGLRLADGTVIVVDRGWIPALAAVPAAPTGEVEVSARVRRSERRRLGQTADDASQTLTEIRRIDTAVLAAQYGAGPLPVYLQQISAAPADNPGLTPLPLPPADEGPHLSYAVQWFIFTACVAAGWVIAVRRSATPPDQRTRRGPPPIDESFASM